MEKQKTKLGARILSKEELNAILPNAESVYEQIAVFRSSIPAGNSKNNDKQFEVEQKTNNIGIMGCRGAGKTSILKTFYHELKNRNENSKGNNKKGDIILPIIVPENMSSKTTLMDAILGRLKSIVDDRKDNEKKEKYTGDCIYSGCNQLEYQYNELVKQYCYIKEDYRDILIQQFTTEQNYLDKTKKVFGSDAEFLKLFNEFVVTLLQSEEEQNEESMIFLFIDDIDLSANRCMDIVRTLLVYLSNPRIVTFISGDMETFEEELTLEFLRQEEALREDVFQETYYAVNGISSTNNSLLERKKTLAYEYLKKIIPPAYRRTIRYWGLEERGNYRIIEGRESEQENLVELLVEVTKEKVGELYFQYKEVKKQDVHRDDERNIDNNQYEDCKHMGLAFHMFDDTSRGLNNVYNVLQEIYDLQKEKKKMEEGERILLFWRLIETIVDSKPLYAKYKSELLKQVIVLGQERVKVDFTNAYYLLYEKAAGLSARERFSIYFLIDFSARLFSQDIRDRENYNLKNKIIQEYLSDESVDDKIAQKRELLICLDDTQEKKFVFDDSIQLMLVCFLKECDFVFVLHLIRYLGRTEIYDILGEKEKKFSDKKVSYKIAYALSRAIQAVNKSEERIEDYLADLYLQAPKIMEKLLGELSLNPWIIYGSWLTDGVNIEVGGMRFINDKKDLVEVNLWNIDNYIYESEVSEGKISDIQQKCLLWAEYENRNLGYWIYYETKLREKKEGRVSFDIKSMADEAVLSGLTKTIMNQMQEYGIINQYEVRLLNDASYADLLEGKNEKQETEIQVLKQIDNLELWDSAYVKKKVSKYLEDARQDIIDKMSQGRVIFDATQLMTGVYSEFEKCYKGLSGKAQVCDLETNVRQVIFLEKDKKKQSLEQFTDGRFYLRLEQMLIIQCLLEKFLKIHERAIYGKKEVKKLWMEIKEMPIVLHTPAWEIIDTRLREREDKFFAENLNLLRVEPEKQLEKEDAAVGNICERWYGISERKNKGIEGLIKEYLGESEEKNYMYFWYLAQKKQIETLKSQIGEKAKMDWSVIEPNISEQDYNVFIFHSYLRYLQVNNNDAKEAGTRADNIVKLAEYMLDSEIIADRRVRNEIYQMISKEIELTEEEFELLFYTKG